MATVGLWPVKNRLKEVIEYAENPDKTTDPKYLEEDLYNALKYAENDDKTDQRLFVAGINCPKQRAYEAMMAVKRRFGKTGGTVAWHGFQSFATGEVTPDEAFEIGKETARRMWGDKYQVVVTVHLNTDNLHCHFIVNPISFRDGSRFQNKIYNHRRLREISDEVCRERGKSILEHSNFYGGKSRRAYWAEKKGHPTHRDMLKRDVEYCLSVSYNRDSFYKQLFGLGYSVDYSRMSVRAKEWDRAVRLSSLGYTADVIDARLTRNLYTPRFAADVWNANLPKKRRSVLLFYIAHDLGYNIEHSRDVVEIYIDLLFLIIINTFQTIKEIKDAVIMSVELRHAVKDLEQFIYDYKFLREADIHTFPQLDRYITDTQTQIKDYERERGLLRNKIRRETDPEVLADNKTQRSEITKKHIEPLRKNLDRAKRIRDKSPHLYDLVRQEFEMEAPYRQLDRNGKMIFKDAPEKGAR
ncbi:MAG: relaxase/mobilization nuclease domain-containing protein [Clostridia bacterium]|nr:relaxase/mobilization nuclease domain-containing protein [Clostridia bacterium]